MAKTDAFPPENYADHRYLAAEITITKQLQDPATSNEVLQEIKELATRARVEAEHKIRKYAKELEDGQKAETEHLEPTICALGRVWMHADAALAYLDEIEDALKTGTQLPKFDPPASIQTAPRTILRISGFKISSPSLN